MDSGSVVFSKCEKALSGTALLRVELVAPAEAAPLLELEVDVPAASAFAGGASVLAAGVYSAELVRALDPAEAEPMDAKDAEAPAPLVRVLLKLRFTFENDMVLVDLGVHRVDLPLTEGVIQRVVYRRGRDSQS